MIGLSGDDKRQCSLADTQNLKTQGLKFLSIWCTKIGWKILEELPLVLGEASMPELAEKAAKEIFGELLLFTNHIIESTYISSCSCGKYFPSPSFCSFLKCMLHVM